MSSFDDDDELANALELGDAAAEQAYSDRFGQRLIAFALSRDFSLHDAENLAQETLLRGWRRMPSFTRGRDMMGWLAGIEHNLMLEEWERQREQAIVGIPGSIPNPQKSRFTPTPEDLERLTLIQLHLTYLKNKNYADAVRLFYRDELSHEAIAKKLGLASADVAREYVRRGLLELKKLIAVPLPDEPNPRGQ